MFLRLRRTTSASGLLRRRSCSASCNRFSRKITCNKSARSTGRAAADQAAACTTIGPGRWVDTLFGRVILRQPRWRSCGCGRIEPQLSADPAYRQSRTTALIGGRATPELVRVQAELGARSSFREAARVMSVLLPTGKAANHTGKAVFDGPRPAIEKRMVMSFIIQFCFRACYR